MALLSLVAKLGLNSTGFDQGLSKAGRQASAFGSGLKATLAGAFSVAAITSFIKDIVDTVSRIKDLSEQFNLTTDEVQNIDYAMRQSGLTFEDFGNAMNKLGSARREAVTENAALLRTFERFGVSAADLNNPLLSNKDVMIKLAEGMKKTNMTAADMAAIMDILGPKAARLANVLAGLEGWEAPSLFREEDIDLIDQMSEEFALFWRDVQISAVETGRFIIDAMNDAFTFISTLIDGALKALKELVFNPYEFAKQMNEALRRAFEETGKQQEQRDRDRADAQAQREKDRADAKRKREEQEAERKKLWERKDVKESTSSQKAKGVALPQGDQLGRIGAFIGTRTNDPVISQIRKTNELLGNIDRVMEFKGIKLKDV